MEDKYVTLSGLKGRRGGPDKTARNPHYRSAVPMKLYRMERVEVVEAQGQFVMHVNDSKRKAVVARPMA